MIDNCVDFGDVLKILKINVRNLYETIKCSKITGCFWFQIFTLEGHDDDVTITPKKITYPGFQTKYKKLFQFDEDFGAFEFQQYVLHSMRTIV